MCGVSYVLVKSVVASCVVLVVMQGLCDEYNDNYDNWAIMRERK